VHGIGGEVLSYQELVRHLGPEQPFYGLRVSSWGEEKPAVCIEAMAAQYLEEVCAVQPEGPYFLGGFSFGGLVAFEMAQQLQARGQHVALLAILDAREPRAGRFQDWWHPLSPLRFLTNSYYWVKDELLQTNFGQLQGRASRKLRAAARSVSGLLGRSELHSRGEDMVAKVFDSSALPEWYRKMLEAHYEATAKYVSKVYPGRITLIRARAQAISRVPTRDLGWGKLAGEGLDVSVIPGNHESILREPCVRVLAERLSAHIRTAQALYRPAELVGVPTSSQPGQTVEDAVGPTRVGSEGSIR
jgi:thioesterase domain-containing protein